MNMTAIRDEDMQGRKAGNRPWRWALLALTLALSLPAQAESYRMDLIVFLDRNAPGEAGRRATLPSSATAIALDNVAALQGAGIRLLPESDFALEESWQRLRNSKRFQPLLRLAWIQKDPPGERGPALRLRLGQQQSLTDTDGGAFLIAPVEGSVALLLNRYLMLDADLAYTQPNGSSYRLRERRRMKRDELHHLDSPRLGVIAKVAKAASTGGTP